MLVLFSFLLMPLSKRLGAPILLLVLVCGMLAGEDGPGGILFSNFPLAYDIGTIALAIVLFGGGLETDLTQTKGVRLPSALLATVGVFLTAGIVGIAAIFLFGFHPIEGLLLGAVISSTDAAATFLLIQQSGLNLAHRVRNTLVLESGLNDPMAIFLSITLTTLAGMPDQVTIASFITFLPVLVMQLGLGFVGGIAGGMALRFLIDNVDVPAGLQPPLALAGAILIFSGISLIGGSGFLAVYLTGIFLSSRMRKPSDRIRQFHEGLQWLSQILFFLLLGILVTPSQLPSVLLSATVLAAVLIFIARPVAVVTCLAPFATPWRHQAYIGWVGLRGAMPIYLSILPVISPGPVSSEFFNIVFIIVLASLIVQGWTVALAARWLKVTGSEAARS